MEIPAASLVSACHHHVTQGHVTQAPQNVHRFVPEETAIALVYGGTTYAVMMASPVDLHDFAVGFSMSEGIITHPAQIERLDVITHPKGLEIQMWLGAPHAHALTTRRRFMAGPVGCGLCGLDSLDQAIRSLPDLSASRLALKTADIAGASDGLRTWQPLHDHTRAVHAAGFLVPDQGIILAREDVGRHNALDKMIGALARQSVIPQIGVAVLSSRVSVEMVQKCAMAGISAIIAVSAPTLHAIDLAEKSGITLIARAQGQGFDVFSHPARISKEIM